ncbi:hypothetical protein, partial [Thalassobaculum sp.]|uniref:hypothetical protein n=1 Tax=Thalassobaculum sp. TaxID=2022740 RepID=UPI0032EFCFBD
QSLGLTVAPRQSTPLRPAKPATIITSLRPANHHPDCRAPLTQIVALHQSIRDHLGQHQVVLNDQYAQATEIA